jgi:type IV pilus assembly protein PilM
MNGWLKSARGLFEGGLEEGRPPRYPDTAVEIGEDRIVGVRLGTDRKSKQRRLKAIETRDLPEGAIEASLTRPNILAPEPVTQAIESILGRLAPGEHRISVILPDSVARVAVLPFATLPRTRRELAGLVRFRMAKSLPFKSDEAVMDLNVLSGAAGAGPGPVGAAVLAIFMQRAVVEQYEALFTALGYAPGLVTLSTFELFNLFRLHLRARRLPDRDGLLLNVAPRSLSLLIVRDEDLIFYRCKAQAQTAEGDVDTLADLRREIYTSLAFYQEKLLGRGIGRCFLRACGPVPAQVVRDGVAAEIGCEVEILDPLQIVPPAEGTAVSALEATRAAAAAGAAAGRRP